MSFKKISVGFALFLILHLVLYAFTGVAFWGVHLEPAKIFAIVTVHIISAVSLMIAYLE